MTTAKLMKVMIYLSVQVMHILSCLLLTRGTMQLSGMNFQMWPQSYRYMRKVVKQTVIKNRRILSVYLQFWAGWTELCTNALSDRVHSFIVSTPYLCA